jgi:hypothetical protein
MLLRVASLTWLACNVSASGYGEQRYRKRGVQRQRIDDIDDVPSCTPSPPSIEDPELSETPDISQPESPPMVTRTRPQSGAESHRIVSANRIMNGAHRRKTPSPTLFVTHIRNTPSPKSEATAPIYLTKPTACRPGTPKSGKIEILSLFTRRLSIVVTSILTLASFKAIRYNATSMVDVMKIVSFTIILIYKIRRSTRQLESLHKNRNKGIHFNGYLYDTLRTGDLDNSSN